MYTQIKFNAAPKKIQIIEIWVVDKHTILFMH